jgi:hypothetical protein
MTSRSILTSCPDPGCDGSIRCTVPPVSRVQSLWITDEHITVSNDTPSIVDLDSSICSGCGRLVRVNWSRLDKSTRAEGIRIPCSNQACENRIRKCPGEHIQISAVPFGPDDEATTRGKTVCNECGESTYFAEAANVPDEIHLQIRFLPGAR